MWSDDDGPYDGRYYRLAETICSPPPPLQRPRPRIVVGGGGERKTLRLVAQYADACNLVAVSPEVVAHKLDVLGRHSDAVGRDESEVEKTILVLGVNPPDDVDAFLAAMELHARMGVALVEIPPQGQDPAVMVARLGEKVVPRLAELGLG